MIYIFIISAFVTLTFCLMCFSRNRTERFMGRLLVFFSFIFSVFVAGYCFESVLFNPISSESIVTNLVFGIIGTMFVFLFREILFESYKEEKDNEMNNQGQVLT